MTSESVEAVERAHENPQSKILCVEDCGRSRTHVGVVTRTENTNQPAKSHPASVQSRTGSVHRCRRASSSRWSFSRQSKGRTATDLPFAHLWAVRAGKAASFHNYPQADAWAKAWGG